MLSFDADGYNCFCSFCIYFLFYFLRQANRHIQKLIIHNFQRFMNTNELRQRKSSCNKENLDRERIVSKTLRTNEVDEFSNSRIRILQKQLLQKEMEIDSYKQLDNKSQTLNKLRLLEIKHETVQNQNNQLRSQLEQYEQVNKTLQRKCETLTLELKRLQLYVEDKKERSISPNNELEQEKIMIKHQIDILRKDKSALQAQLTTQQSLHQQLENTNQSLNNEIHKFQAQLAAQQQLHQQLEHSNQCLHTEVQKLNLEINRIQTLNYSQEASNKILNNDILKLNSEITNLKIHNTQIESKYQEATKQQLSEELTTLRSTAVQAQKDKLKNTEKIQDLENKLRTSTEYTLKLQDLISQKSKQIQQLQYKAEKAVSLEEDNYQLQDDVEKISENLEELQQENQRICRFQQQRIEEMKKQLSSFDQVKSDLKYKTEEITQLKREIEKDAQFLEDYKEIKDQLNRVRDEKRQLEIKLNELEQINRQSFDQVRIQVEGQILMKNAQERIQMENHIWQLTAQLQEFQSQLDQHSQRNSGLLIEIEQLNQQLSDKQINAKQILVLEGQLKNQAIECEKLRSQLQLKSQEIEQLRNKIIQYEGVQTYSIELERKVASLSQDNQRLNSIIVERCKSAW